MVHRCRICCTADRAGPVAARNWPACAAASLHATHRLAGLSGDAHRRDRKRDQSAGGRKLSSSSSAKSQEAKRKRAANEIYSDRTVDRRRHRLIGAMRRGRACACHHRCELAARTWHELSDHRHHSRRQHRRCRRLSGPMVLGRVAGPQRLCHRHEPGSGRWSAAWRSASATRRGWLPAARQRRPTAIRGGRSTTWPWGSSAIRRRRSVRPGRYTAARRYRRSACAGLSAGSAAAPARLLRPSSARLLRPAAGIL